MEKLSNYTEFPIRKPYYFEKHEHFDPPFQASIIHTFFCFFHVIFVEMKVLKIGWFGKWRRKFPKVAIKNSHQDGETLCLREKGVAINKFKLSLLSLYLYTKTKSIDRTFIHSFSTSGQFESFLPENCVDHISQIQWCQMLIRKLFCWTTKMKKFKESFFHYFSVCISLFLTDDEISCKFLDFVFV